MVRVSKSETTPYTLFIEIGCVVLVVATVVLVRQTLYEPAFVPSDSMLPTLEVGDRIVVHRRAYANAKPARGDIVLFTWPDNPNEQMIKRVIGAPGEEVTVFGGRVLINRKPLKETYTQGGGIRERPLRVKLGPDQVRVMGDKRDHSEDSRDHGPLKIDRIIGRATYRYWPSARRGTLD